MAAKPGYEAPPTGNDWGASINAEPLVPVPSGVSVLTVDFTDAQLKTLNISPLSILPTPGSGNILVPIMVIARALFDTPYDTWPDSTLFQYASGAAFYTITSWDPAAYPVQYSSGFTESGAINTFTDVAINMSGDSSAPTGGSPSNILTVTIVYFVSG